MKESLFIIIVIVVIAIILSETQRKIRLVGLEQLGHLQAGNRNPLSPLSLQMTDSPRFGVLRKLGSHKSSTQLLKIRILFRRLMILILFVSHHHWGSLPPGELQGQPPPLKPSPRGLYEASPPSPPIVGVKPESMLEFLAVESRELVGHGF